MLKQHGGLPNAMRADVWARLTQSKTLGVRNDVLYRQLIMSQLSTAKEREIRQDVTRTFPELPVYMQEKGKEALYRVLMAYSIYDSEVAYW